MVQQRARTLAGAVVAVVLCAAALVVMVEEAGQGEAVLTQLQTRNFLVKVPYGYMAGDAFMAHVPGLGKVAVTVPVGVKAGQETEISVPDHSNEKSAPMQKLFQMQKLSWELHADPAEDSNDAGFELDYGKESGVEEAMDSAKGDISDIRGMAGKRDFDDDPVKEKLKAILRKAEKFMAKEEAYYKALDAPAKVSIRVEQGSPGKEGPRGFRGPSGPMGALGPPGPTGPQGFVGPVGEEGDQGPQGVQGPVGDTGPTGKKGLTGPQGPMGVRGKRGPNGPLGKAGLPGWPGPEGLRGSDGLQGPAGPAGQAMPGPPGRVGPQGDAGAPGTPGLKGATGTDGAQGAAGKQGPEGPAGPQGPDGKDFVA